MRPEIITQPSESVLENFQNQTLRPILKQQNELLLAVFRQYVSGPAYLNIEADVWCLLCLHWQPGH